MTERNRPHEFSNKTLVAIGTVLLLGGISAAAAAHGLDHSKAPKVESLSSAIDLLEQDWSHVNGVTQDGHTLHVAGTDSKIVEQDGSGGQPNPAVNLYGSRLRTTGDFSLTAHLVTQHDGSASVRLYDKPPVIADEFRVEPASIAVTEQDSKLTVRAWNGGKPKPGSVTDPSPVFSSTVSLADQNPDIVITRTGSDLTVQAGHATITDRGGAKPFRSGSIWLGLSSPDKGFDVDKLTAQGANSGSVSVVNTLGTAAAAEVKSAVTPNGLQALANKTRPDFIVGAAAALGPWVSDSAYANQLTQNFGEITLENAMKPQFLSPKQGVYTFQEADALIAMAEKNGMKVHGHTLAFSEALPAWMRNLPTGTDAERASTAGILTQYLTDVMTHFKGKFDTLDVTNEPLDTEDGPNLQDNVWRRAFGDDYAAKVSQIVYSIDPHVKQFVNENGAEVPGERQDALFAFVHNANAKGGHYWGIGLQSHVYDMSTDAISAEDLNNTINRAAREGLHVRISENDVTDDAGTDKQAEQFNTIFMTCLRNPNCYSYSTWGVNDRYDLFIDDDGSLQRGHDLLFDGNKPTAAYQRIQQSLQQ